MAPREKQEDSAAQGRELPRQIGALADDVAWQIAGILEQDSKFDYATVLRATELRPEQIATYAASLVFTNDWHTRLELRSRDIIKHMVEQHFRPPEREGPDPVQASAQKIHSQFDPWQRHNEIHAPDHVVTLQPAGPEVVVTYTEGEEESEASRPDFDEDQDVSAA